jgi:hypothetical protein
MEDSIFGFSSILGSSSSRSSVQLQLQRNSGDTPKGKVVVDDSVLDECATSILMLQNPEIYSIRTYQLRKRQREAGVEFVNLRAEQKGMLPVNFMHHVSKVVEGKMAFYRVRICRTCSGQPTLIELGSFADVESALLVNDAHEITHGRTKQLHLLVKGDINYLSWLHVRCRGNVNLTISFNYSIQSLKLTTLLTYRRY